MREVRRGDEREVKRGEEKEVRKGEGGGRLGASTYITVCMQNNHYILVVLTWAFPCVSVLTLTLTL